MLELLTGALIAGAVAGVTGVATDAIKEAYTGLKNIIATKFGKTRGAMDALEEDPNDEDAQKLVTKRLAEAKVADDAEVQAAATKLDALLKAHGLGSVAQNATGTGNVQVAGSSNTTHTYTSTGNTGITNQGSTIHGDVFQGDKVGRDKIGRQVNTSGGTYVEGDVSAGEFVGRDKIVNHYGTSPDLSAITSAEARALVPLLNEYFAVTDIDSLCFEMGIDAEQLRDQTKDEKARSLVQYVQVRGRLDELKKQMRVARPNLRAQLS